MKTFYHSTQEYQEIIQEKLTNRQLRENLKTAMDTLKNNRKNLINARYTKWSDLREEGRRVKLKALTHLDILLRRFEENATKNGIKVHWASDAKEANEIIYNLMQEKKVTSILKGKSMASEEIHLNAFLKQKGLDAIETDLGELIIQLIDETPVHIVVPAVHKNRYEIGEIFQEKLGASLESQPEKLNEIARKHLRKEFKTFKMGLTGANFAIADEGAIWLVENEGNGRMTSTACDIHVAICGIEKVVESFEDASILGTLLVPSATGAPITCYNNIITSPRKEGEKDGPREVHVILLDNNRSNMLNDRNFFKSLSCIRCGTCLNHCPVYDKIGGHAYLSTYPGPIGEVISPQLFGLNNCAPMLDLCSLCGRCSEVCPVKIPLAELIRDLRSEKVGQGYGKVLGYKKEAKNSIEQFLMSGFAKNATCGKKWRSVLWLAKNLGGMGKIFHRFIPILNKWTKYRNYPKIDANLHSEIKKLQGVIYE
ncbi:LutB/LldF family L-lactate oxidation iron-sulfur protein [Helicobacter anatolicus]|uniref:LutB/LldF family L-lactate oxidation iron-sulfur protein n=1 Tax=Helicobacter anatolicus TaxID=2905874 RepID=UPI001E3BB07F|nr:LutB/LldF family L-lactate oxidation iron-sulfur protein [Helicobacter anatolicus]MCE3039469.1 LutB/LldF family L-lactate oxidation iron-sulfur protein [Helicobacter anatolicus]